MAQKYVYASAHTAERLYFLRFCPAGENMVAICAHRRSSAAKLCMCRYLRSEALEGALGD